MDDSGEFVIGTTEADRTFYPEEIIVITTEAPSVLGLATLSIGTNSGATNILPAQVLGVLGLGAANRLVTFDPTEGLISPVQEIAGNTTIKGNIGVPATSGGKMWVIVRGFYSDYEV